MLLASESVTLDPCHIFHSCQLGSQASPYAHMNTAIAQVYKITHQYTNIKDYTCIDVCVCVYVCMYEFMYVYVDFFFFFFFFFFVCVSWTDDTFNITKHTHPHMRSPMKLE